MQRPTYMGLVRAVGLTAGQFVERGLPREDAMQAALDLFGPPLIAHGPAQSMQSVLAIAPSFGLAWFESSFACIEVGERLAASLACTSLPKEYVDSIEPPWRCFLIRAAGLNVEVLVLFARDGIVKTLSFPEGRMSLGFEQTLGEWAKLEMKSLTGGEAFVSLDQLQREESLVGRIICGTCVEVMTPQFAKHKAIGPRHPHGKRKDGLPASWVFNLTRDVKVDVRQAVRDYLSGTGSSLTLQHLVRGHYKRQAHGKDLQERKWIHVEPYWRGPEDAPIALRSHVIGGKP